MRNIRRIIRRRNVDQSAIAQQVDDAADKLSDEKMRKLHEEMVRSLASRDIARADLKIAEHEISVLKKQVENLQARVKRFQELDDERQA